MNHEFQVKRWKKIIHESKEAHEKIGNKTHELLDKYKDEEKEPGKMAEAMSWIKINVNYMLDSSDSEISRLMMDGCNMGIQSISRYINQYKAADQQTKNLVQNLIEAEEKLMKNLRNYL